MSFTQAQFYSDMVSHFAVIPLISGVNLQHMHDKNWYFANKQVFLQFHPFYLNFVCGYSNGINQGYLFSTIRLVNEFLDVCLYDMVRLLEYPF